MRFWGKPVADPELRNAAIKVGRALATFEAMQTDAAYHRDHLVEVSDTMFGVELEELKDGLLALGLMDRMNEAMR